MRQCRTPHTMRIGTHSSTPTRVTINMAASGGRRLNRGSKSHSSSVREDCWAGCYHGVDNEVVEFQK
jgi:hypothetical protein